MSPTEHKPDWNAVADRMLLRARSHRTIAGVSMTAAIVLLLGGLWILLAGPSFGPPAGSSLSEKLTWLLVRKPEPAATTSSLLADGLVRLLHMSVVVLGAQLLVTMYRYNMRVYQHWAVRAYALVLAKPGDLDQLGKVVTVLTGEPPAMDSLPDKPFFPMVPLGESRAGPR